MDLSCGTRNIHCAMLASAVAACSLSLIVAHGLQSMWASVVGVHRLSCSEACEILVPRPGIKPSSPALQAGLLTSGPSGKSLADSALHQVPFLGLWTATFLLCHHMAKRERRLALRLPLLMSQSHYGRSTILTSPIPNFIPKAPFPPTITLKIRVPKYKLGRNTHIQSITLLYT